MRLVQRKGKYNEKYKVIIKIISKEMQISQWIASDELKKKKRGNQSFCANKVKTDTWNIYK